MTKADVQGRLNRETNPIPGERPGFNPQFIDSDGYATDVTPNTPFPSGSYVQTDAGVWVPQKGNNDGAAHVQLTGSIGEELISEIFTESFTEGGSSLVYENDNPIIIDHLQFAANDHNAQIRLFDKHNNVIRGDLLPDGTGENPSLVDWINTRASGLWEILVFDKDNKLFKFQLKNPPLVLPEGLKIELRAQYNQTLDVSCLILGRTFR